MDFREIDKKLQVEFADKKIRAEQIAENNNMLANSFPAFKKLIALEKELILEISRLKADKKRNKSFEENLEVVREEKQKILAKFGLKESDLYPHYECTKCNDAGYVNSNLCECYKRRRNEELIKLCGIKPNSNLSLDSYNTEIVEDKKQKDQLEKLKNTLVKWKNSYPNVKKINFVISGGTGIGKTYITECLANDLIKMGYSVCFTSAFELNNSFLNYHTTFNGYKKSWISPYIESDFLFIDDLGTEPLMNNVTLNYLYMVLSERERFELPTIITTNLSPVELLDRYNERIYSRMMNKLLTCCFKIPGNDLRMK